MHSKMELSFFKLRGGSANNILFVCLLIAILATRALSQENIYAEQSEHFDSDNDELIYPDDDVSIDSGNNVGIKNARVAIRQNIVNSSATSGSSTKSTLQSGRANHNTTGRNNAYDITRKRFERSSIRVKHVGTPGNDPTNEEIVKDTRFLADDPSQDYEGAETGQQPNMEYYEEGRGSIHLDEADKNRGSEYYEVGEFPGHAPGQVEAADVYRGRGIDSSHHEDKSQKTASKTDEPYGDFPENLYEATVTVKPIDEYDVSEPSKAYHKARAKSVHRGRGNYNEAPNQRERSNHSTKQSAIRPVAEDDMSEYLNNRYNTHPDVLPQASYEQAPDNSGKTYAEYDAGAPPSDEGPRAKNADINPDHNSKIKENESRKGKSNYRNTDNNNSFKESAETSPTTYAQYVPSPNRDESRSLKSGRANTNNPRKISNDATRNIQINVRRPAVDSYLPPQRFVEVDDYDTKMESHDGYRPQLTDVDSEYSKPNQEDLRGKYDTISPAPSSGYPQNDQRQENYENAEKSPVPIPKDIYNSNAGGSNPRTTPISSIRTEQSNDSPNPPSHAEEYFEKEPTTDEKYNTATTRPIVKSNRKHNMKPANIHYPGEPYHKIDSYPNNQQQKNTYHQKPATGQFYDSTDDYEEHTPSEQHFEGRQLNNHRNSKGSVTRPGVIKRPPIAADNNQQDEFRPSDYNKSDEPDVSVISQIKDSGRLYASNEYPRKVVSVTHSHKIEQDYDKHNTSTGDKYYLSRANTKEQYDSNSQIPSDSLEKTSYGANGELPDYYLPKPSPNYNLEKPIERVNGYVQKENNKYKYQDVQDAQYEQSTKLPISSDEYQLEPEYPLTDKHNAETPGYQETYASLKDEVNHKFQTKGEKSDAKTDSKYSDKTQSIHPELGMVDQSPDPSIKSGYETSTPAYAKDAVSNRPSSQKSYESDLEFITNYPLFRHMYKPKLGVNEQKYNQATTPDNLQYSLEYNRHGSTPNDENNNKNVEGHGSPYYDGSIEPENHHDNIKDVTTDSYEQKVNRFVGAFENLPTNDEYVSNYQENQKHPANQEHSKNFRSSSPIVVREHNLRDKFHNNDRRTYVEIARRPTDFTDGIDTEYDYPKIENDYSTVAPPIASIESPNDEYNPKYAVTTQSSEHVSLHSSQIPTTHQPPFSKTRNRYVGSRMSKGQPGSTIYPTILAVPHPVSKPGSSSDSGYNKKTPVPHGSIQAILNDSVDYYQKETIKTGDDKGEQGYKTANITGDYAGTKRGCYSLIPEASNRRCRQMTNKGNGDSEVKRHSRIRPRIPLHRGNVQAARGLQFRGDSVFESVTPRGYADGRSTMYPDIPSGDTRRRSRNNKTRHTADAP